MLDDHILKAQTMHSSAYIKPFEEEMKEWEEKLISMQVRAVDNLLPWLLVCNDFVTGYTGRVAPLPGVVAVPGAHLQLGGHHEADAGGGEEVQQGGPHLEEHHGQDGGRPEGAQGHGAAEHARQPERGQRSLGSHHEGTQRLSGEEKALLS